MRASKLFSKVLRESPKDEIAINAGLLERGGFVYKNSAGIYSFLPLGWRVIQNIAAIIRKEMDAIGGEEIFMPALVERSYMEATGRWDIPISFEVRGKKETKAGFTLGWTHEEVISAIATRYLQSYKDLPRAVYQIQTKFRNEPRVKSGLLRGREFMMKDLYSFHASEEDFNAYYANVAEAYTKIFKRCGLETIYTLAAGGDFTTRNTHEFQVASPVGEDTIYVCEGCAYAENDEISDLKESGACPKCGLRIRKERSIEVGNIFPLGTKYSEPLNLRFLDEAGNKHFVLMGSYGIGLGRLMATVVEVHHDDAGIIWPQSVAPFLVHLLELSGASALDLYEDLQKRGIPVLYDDRQTTSGEKFVEADLLGLPYRALLSPKTGDKIEFKERGKKEMRLVTRKELFALLEPRP